MSKYEFIKKRFLRYLSIFINSTLVSVTIMYILLLSNLSFTVDYNISSLCTLFSGLISVLFLYLLYGIIPMLLSAFTIAWIDSKSSLEVKLPSLVN